MRTHVLMSVLLTAVVTSGCFSPVTEFDAGAGGGAGGGQGQTCIDDDADGYVAGSGCDDKPGGDCAPYDPEVSPAKGERCTNGKDDDCDGLVDEADPDCGPRRCLGLGGESCLTWWNCGLGSRFCDNGCCQGCAVVDPRECEAGLCHAPATIDPNTGCPAAPECRPCPTSTCPEESAPVCAAFDARGTDPRTFRNQCEAESWGATVLHAGECRAGEGLACGSPRCEPGLPCGSPGCGPGTELYCRDACPECDAELRRCTAKGTCLLDLDCPAGLPAPPQRTCANGSPSVLKCVNHRCVQACP